MKSKVILLGLLLAAEGCQSMHRLGIMDGEEIATSNNCGAIWFESFVEAVDHAESFEEIQEVIARGKDYLKNHVEWEDDEYTPLHYAAEQGDLKAVSALIKEQKVPIDIQTGTHERTPLHLAALQGQFHIVKFLLEKDAKLLDQRDKQGDTALFYAASGIRGAKNTEVVKFLIEQNKGRAILFKKDEPSLLDCAVNANNSPLVEYLIPLFSDQEDLLKQSLQISKDLCRRDISRILKEKLREMCKGKSHDCCDETAPHTNEAH